MKATAAQLEFIRTLVLEGESIDAVKGFCDDHEAFFGYDVDEIVDAHFDKVTIPLQSEIQETEAVQHSQALQSQTLANVSKYQNAPYRFIPVNDRIVTAESAVVEQWHAGHLHDQPLPDQISGVLDVAVYAENALLVGDGGDVTRPMKLGKSAYVIPGATLRGLVRAGMEIAAFGRLSQTNAHRRYGIRMFEHKLMKGDEQTGRMPLKAGWLQKDGDTIKVTPCKWWRVKIRDLNQQGSNPPGAFHRTWLKEMTLDSHYAAFRQRDGAASTDEKPVYDFRSPSKFTFSDAVGDGGGFASPSPTGGSAGVYVFSHTVPAISGLGLSDDDQTALEKSDKRSRECRLLEIKALDAQEAALKRQKGFAKKTEAVFEHVADDAPSFALPDDVWQTFVLNNSSYSRNKPVPEGNWARLVHTFDAGRRIPIFYTPLTADGEGIRDFGLVRTYKRAHLRTVGDVLDPKKETHLKTPDDADWTPDMVEALFGYVYEPEDKTLPSAFLHGRRHLKSRVAFGFAQLDEETPAREAPAVRTLQAQPKPSFGPFYLAGGVEKDWSDPQAQLAGRKRYPVRPGTGEDVRTMLEPGNIIEEKAKINGPAGSSLVFLEPVDAEKGMTFRAEIHLHNVTPVELGALIWVLELGGDTRMRHLIGRAKTAGAGRSKIEVTGARLAADAAFEKADLMKRFESYMTKDAKLPNWRQSPQIKDFLASCDPDWAGRQDQTRLKYLELKDHQNLRRDTYKNRSEVRLLGFR